MPILNCKTVQLKYFCEKLDILLIKDDNEGSVIKIQSMKPYRKMY